MDERAVIGIALLFGISLVVRIVPAFLPVNFSETTQYRIKTNLPVAVFINLLVYCAYQEITYDPLPAMLSLAALVLLYKPLGLLWSIALGTALYIFSGQYL